MEFCVYDPSKFEAAIKKKIKNWLTWPFNTPRWWPVVAFIQSLRLLWTMRGRNSVQKEEPLFAFDTHHQRMQRTWIMENGITCVKLLLQYKQFSEGLISNNIFFGALLPQLSVSFVKNFYLCQNSKMHYVHLIGREMPAYNLKHQKCWSGSNRTAQHPVRAWLHYLILHHFPIPQVIYYIVLKKYNFVQFV